MLIKSNKSQIIWSNANCTVTLNLDPCFSSTKDEVRWLATTTCKFMKTEYESLEDAYYDFRNGTINSETEVLETNKEAAA